MERKKGKDCMQSFIFSSLQPCRLPALQAIVILYLETGHVIMYEYTGNSDELYVNSKTPSILEQKHYINDIESNCYCMCNSFYFVTISHCPRQEQW